ncbi:MAG: phosphotriesterase-related protein [Gammaproteobacteria bacterium]|nr:phosphotriesterase-related protein [Gammaproteobacteria bacterium]
MTSINTVTGPIAADQLGFTLMHEHIMVSAPNLYRSHPALFGPEDRESRAVQALERARAAGISTLVDATTFDLGREPELLARVAAASGMNIINVTGWWLDVPRFLRGVSANQMAREFVRDVEHGFGDTGIKAGLLKCAADLDGVTGELEVMARAVARAHIQTGLPIMAHSHPSTQLARRQIEIFREEGVDLTRVKIDHCNDTTDTEYLRWILDQGCYLGWDRYPGRLVSPRMRTRTLKTLIDMGHAERICPSHDCICLHLHKEQNDGSIAEQHEFYLRNPDQYLFIHRHVLPELRDMGVSEQTIQGMFVDNPRRFFSGG